MFKVYFHIINISYFEEYAAKDIYGQRCVLQTIKNQSATMMGRSEYIVDSLAHMRNLG